MKKQKFFLLSGFTWELIRFFLYFFFITYFQFQKLLWNRQTILWLILLGSSQLIIPAGFLLLFFHSTKFRATIQLLRIGKIINLFSSLVLFIDEIISGNALLLVPIPYLSSTEGISFLILSLTIFFDLILLYFLLSYKEERPETENRVTGENVSPYLPDFSETEVKNEIHVKKNEEK